MLLLGDIKDHSLRKTLFLEKISMQALRLSLPFIKSFCWSFRYVPFLWTKFFSRAPVKCFSLYGSNYTDLVVLRNVAFGEIKDHSLRTTLFQEKNSNVSFGIVSTLCKKVFSRAPVKCFSLYGLNNSDSLVFGNATFGEIKNHSLRTRRFQKIFAMNVLGICLSYLKRYFQEHQWSAFLFMVQITQIFFSFWECCF